MLIHYRITSGITAFIIGLVILFLIRRDHMQPRYAAWWLSIACGVILFGLFPNLIDIIGHRLGVNYPPVLLIVLCIGLILIKMLKMDIDRSDRERRLRRLTQRMAILEGLMEEKKSPKTQKDEGKEI